MKKEQLYRATLLVSLLVGPFAHAGDWSTSFAADHLRGSLPGEGLRVVVVGAGEVNVDLSKAAAIFVEQLRATGKAPLVMDAAALGDVSSLDDQAIVARAASLPVEWVVVLRVFPGDKEPTAVITWYDKQAKAATAFAVARGNVPDVGSKAPSGVGLQAAESVSKIVQSGQGDRNSAVKAYRDKRIRFPAGMLVMQNGMVISLGTPHLGETAIPMEWETFYTTVGHPELAKSYSNRSLTRNIVLWGGVGLAAVGLVLVLLPTDDDREVGFGAKRWAGLSISLVGSLAVSSSMLISPQPITNNEAHELARQYNLKLQSELGLSEDEVQKLGSTKPQMYLSPMLSPAGGGLSFGVRY